MPKSPRHGRGHRPGRALPEAPIGPDLNSPCSTGRRARDRAPVPGPRRTRWPAFPDSAFDAVRQFGSCSSRQAGAYAEARRCSAGGLFPTCWIASRTRFADVVTRAPRHLPDVASLPRADTSRLSRPGRHQACPPPADSAASPTTRPWRPRAGGSCERPANRLCQGSPLRRDRGRDPRFWRATAVAGGSDASRSAGRGDADQAHVFTSRLTDLPGYGVGCGLETGMARQFLSRERAHRGEFVRRGHAGRRDGPPSSSCSARRPGESARASPQLGTGRRAAVQMGPRPTTTAGTLP